MRIDYGWYVVAALFVMLAVASGLGFYNLSVYMNALVRTHGFPVGSVSGAIALFFVTTGLAGLGAGRLIQRFDVRWTVAAGGVIGGLALAALGSVTALWQLYAIYAVFGIGHGLASLVPAMTLVTRWFAERRSIALAVATTGLSVGGILLTPASAALIARLGVAGASPWLGAVWFIGIVPVTALVLRPWPAAAPHAREAAAAGRLERESSWPYADAVRSRFFLGLTAAWIAVMSAQVGGIAHVFNLVAGRVDEATAASAVSMVAAASILGRFAGGWLVTRYPARRFALICIAWQGGAMTLLAVGETAGALLVAAAAFGATVGNLLMLQPLLLADAFGVRDYGRIYSLSQLLTTLGIAAGPAVLGLAHDAFEGYGAAFALAAGGSAAAFALVLAAGALPGTPARRRAGAGGSAPAELAEERG